MRKLTILLAVAALSASTVGCCSRCRNFFHKANPCGTTMTPAVLSAPVAMSAPPMMAQPVMAQPMMAAPNVCVEAQPQCVPCCPQPCVPCCPDPCAQGMVVGYGGGDGCCDGSTMGGFVPQGAVQMPAGGIQTFPSPAPEN